VGQARRSPGADARARQLASRSRPCRPWSSDLADALEYAELADAEGDEALLEDARAQLKA
jgi:peptide chain release factor 2